MLNCSNKYKMDWLILMKPSCTFSHSFFCMLLVWSTVPITVNAAIDCSFNLSYPSLYKEIEEQIGTGGNLRLVRYHFKVTDDNGPFSESRKSDLYLVNPYKAVLAIDSTAKALLHLKEYFVPMSLFTLDFSVTDFNVDLVQTPANCLANVSATDLETEVKLLIFRNFGTVRSSVISLEGEVCNQYIKVVDGNLGVATYNCCKLDAGGQFKCGDLERNVWTDVLFAAIIIVQVLFVLYSPSLVPKRGKKGDNYVNFVHKPEKPFTINVVKINTNEKVLNAKYLKVDPFPFADISSLKRIIQELKEDTIYTIHVAKVHMLIKDIHIIQEEGAPVSLLSFLKSFFVQCKMGKELKDLRSCCNARTCPVICRNCECFCCCAENVYKKCGAWYQTLTFLMTVIVGIVMTIPWWFRVWFYYAIEEGSIAPRRNIIERNGLTEPYPGSLALSLTPLHPFFLAIYALFVVFVVFLSCLPDDIKFDWNSTLRKSLENTRDENRFDIFVKFIAWMILPMKKFGILGILLFPLWLIPVMTLGLIVLGILIFPMVNFTFRMLLLILYTCRWQGSTPNYMHYFEGNFCKGFYARIAKWTEKSISFNVLSKHLMWYVAALTLSLLEIIITLIIIVECLAFYAEWISYLIIGIILNSNDILKYMTLSLSIVFYAYSSFSSVGSRYQSFAMYINKEIRNRVGDDIMSVAMQRKEFQKERAFAVPRTAEVKGYDGERLAIVASSDHFIKWNAKRLLLFLDTDDITFISKEFFFKSANMGHTYCPGLVHVLYLDALVQLFWITLFLVFEIVVITAFGQANQISGLNQTLATLATGFLPFVFKKFLMKSHSAPGLDGSNIAWKTQLSETIDSFEEKWFLGDIATDKPPEPAGQIRSVNDIQNDVELVAKERDNGDMEFWVRQRSEAEHNLNSTMVHVNMEGINKKERIVNDKTEKQNEPTNRTSSGVSVHIPGSAAINISH